MTEAVMAALPQDRQAALAALVLPGEPFADIGTDHGHLPIRLITQGKVPRAIGADLREGPLSYARRHRAQAALTQDQLELRLGPGMTPLRADEASSVVIAGMGGTTIAQIIEETDPRALNLKRLILQPNIGQRTLRRFLWHRGLAISQEYLIEEAQRIYAIMVIDLPPAPSLAPPEDEADWAFGPTIRAQRSQTFITWLRQEELRLTQLLSRLESAKRDITTERDEATALLKLVRDELAQDQT